MTKSNKPDKPSRARESGEKYQEAHTPKNPEAHSDIVKMHGDYVRHRLEGGAPATAQAYARAMAQWQQLPGAVPSLPPKVLAKAQEAPAHDGQTPNPGTPNPGLDTHDKGQKS